MALVTTETPNFIGGVSQQPAAMRFPNQCEEQENAVSTIIEGLKKRPCTEHIGLLPSAPTGEVFWHTINRDTTEKYMVAIANKELRVYDINAGGATKTVYDINGDVAAVGVSGDFDYLALTSASDIEAITLADFTIVVNKSVQAKMDSTLTTARKPEALVFVKAGNYDTTYSVTYKEDSDTGTVTYLTKDASIATNSDDIQTNHIAAALHHGITASSLDTSTYPGISRTGDWPLDAANWSFALEGSSIWIQRDDTDEFTIKVDDSVASTNLSVIKDEVQSFVELPTVAPNGFVVKIDGLPDQGSAGATAYYVAFRTTSDTTTGVPGTAAFEEGVWEETVAPGIEYKVAHATMPHILVRLSSGDFLWTKVDGSTLAGAIGSSAPFTAPAYDERQAGDDTTNGRPPWLAKADGTDGENIRNMAFFADRLVYLSGQDISLSESGQYFNWFRVTVTDLLASARISVTAAHTNVNLLNYAVPMREQLVVFSQFTQFALRGSSDGTLTPGNVWVTAATEYESSAGVAPVSSRRSIFAAAPRGTATLVRELFDSGSTARPQFEAVEITSQVPTYLQGTAKRLVASTIEDMLVALVKPATGTTDTLYAFKYLINGDERVQSAWSKYTLGGTATDIVHIDWIDQTLYLAVARSSEVSLERMDFEAYLQDTSSIFRVHLDRRLKNTDTGVSASYSAAADETTFTIPYTVGAGATVQVVTRESGATDAGQQLTVKSASGTSVVVSGDQSAVPVWLGEQYEMKYVFSEFHMKSAGGRTAGRPVPSTASFRVRNGTLLFEDSAYFKVKVTPKDQTAYEYPMTGKYLSSASTLLGAIGLESGHFQFPVMADHKAVTVEILNDSPLPARLIAAEWESNFHTRNARY